MYTPREIKELYKQGVNITEALRSDRGIKQNNDEIIEIAYDMQAGSYITAMESQEMAMHKKEYTQELARNILSLCDPTSIMEAGVGEATTLAGVLNEINCRVDSFGFDLSWSRVAHAKRWLQSKGLNDTTLCTGNLFHIPFADSSVDVVYTSHSIEPNGGNERLILQELFRVARRYLVLLEPAYELSGDNAKMRMELHGYCKNLKGIAEHLGYAVIKHELFPYASNPLNPTAITIIKKESGVTPSGNIIVCPKFKSPLQEIGGMYFSQEALSVYPVVGGIPCLRIENAIFASNYMEIMMDK